LGPKIRAAVVSPHRDASARRNIRDASRHERAMVARVSGAQLKMMRAGEPKFGYGRAEICVSIGTTGSGQLFLFEAPASWF
jgi:hypothetical protein